MMYDHQGLSPVSFPFELRTEADYRAAVAGCEVRRVFTKRETLLIKGSLHFDRRDKGSHGRALKVDMCGLSKGDRLEPCDSFPDVAADIPDGVPVQFWRQSKERGVKHRNPIFDPETCINPYKVLAIDSLHTLSLGVFQVFLAHLIAALVWGSNVWDSKVQGAHRLQLVIGDLTAELFQWYHDEAKLGRHHTRVQSLEVGMFGDHDKPTCKLHGAETNGFLEFSLSLITKHGGRLALAAAWSSTAQHLVRIKNMIKEFKTAWPASRIQAKFLGDSVRSPYVVSYFGSAGLPSAQHGKRREGGGGWGG